MEFQEALAALQAGKKVRRAGWILGRFLYTQKFEEYTALFCHIPKAGNGATDIEYDDAIENDWEIMP